MSIASLTAQNLLSPVVLFFILGLGAALVRSDLAIPESVAKFLAVYLLMAIGFRGGVEVSHHGLDRQLLTTIIAGILLSAATPFLAFALLRLWTPFDRADVAAIAAHYGSISAVTFLAVTSALTQLGTKFDGWLVAVAAAMETPALFTALWLASRSGGKDRLTTPLHILTHGSIVILLGAFAVGIVTGQNGMTTLKPLVLDLFPGLLCFFLLDLGLLAGRWLLTGWKKIPASAVGFAIAMPLMGAAIGCAVSIVLGLSAGSTAVLSTLVASASYIAAPAAMRLALPEANPAIALTMSLGITFPFNLVIGIPIYVTAAHFLRG
jgi:hypothetical protein